MFSDLEQLRRCTLAFDFGTARTRIHLQGVGVIVDEPSVVALCTRTGRLIAAGSAARALEGRAGSGTEFLRPIHAGTVTDVGMTQRMLRMYLRGSVRGWGWFRSRMVMRRVAACVAHGSGQVALDAVAQVLGGLGARRIVLVDRVYAVAAGCGLDSGRAEGSVVVHCGTVSTHIAMLSLGSVVTAQTVPVGERTFLQVLDQHIRSTHHLVLPQRDLEDVCRLLAAQPSPEEVELCGREPATGAWRTVTVGAAGLRQAARIPMSAIVHALGQVLQVCSPDLVADLMETGLTLTGSSITRLGLDRMITNTTGITVRTPAQPELSIIRGLGRLLDGTPHPEPTSADSDARAHRPTPAQPAPQAPSAAPVAPSRSDTTVQKMPTAAQKDTAGAVTPPRSSPRARTTDPGAPKVRRPCRRTRLKYPSAWDRRSGKRQLRGNNGTGHADTFRRPARYPK